MVDALSQEMVTEALVTATQEVINYLELYITQEHIRTTIGEILAVLQKHTKAPSTWQRNKDLIDSYALREVDHLKGGQSFLQVERCAVSASEVPIALQS